MLSMNMKETELCLGLPGCDLGTKTGNKRGFSETVDLKLNLKTTHHSNDLETHDHHHHHHINNLTSPPNTNISPPPPPAKAQVVGWPPVRSHRKNIMAQKSGVGGEELTGAAFVKVCMDGAPYLRKVDLKMYKSYQNFSDALAKMFSSFTMGNNYGSQGMIDFMNESKVMDLLNRSEYVPTYQDKDGDWMLVGDVPWTMFVNSCKRLRIMKGSEAIGLAPRAMEKCKNKVAQC